MAPDLVSALDPGGNTVIELPRELNQLPQFLEKSFRSAKLSLEDVICAPGNQHVFNLAAQVWNHTFYWNSLTPDGPSTPSGALAAAVRRGFGDLDGLRRELAAAANGEFGSGWAWLTRDAAGDLHVFNSDDAQNPVRSGLTPLLTIDVWEHAYYLDYQNERNRYVKAVVEELLDWRFAEKNYGG